MNLQQQFDALPWWERPINQTSYHCDDLTKLVLVAHHIMKEKYPNYIGMDLSPLNVWFTEYNPSKSAHNRAPIWNSISCLVKTTRYSTESVELFSAKVKENPGRNWFSQRYVPDSESNSHRQYQMIGIATPTMRHFDREDPTETIRMGQGYAPRELIRQAVFYLSLRYMGAGYNSYGCSVPEYRFEEGAKLWEELGPLLQLRFDRKYRPKGSVLGVRQHMAYRNEAACRARESLRVREVRAKTHWQQYKEAADLQKRAVEAYHETLNETSLYLLSLGQEAPNPTAKAVTTQDPERDNA